MERKFEFPDGATPLFDHSGLIPSWVLDIRDLNRVEGENIISAQRKYFRNPVKTPKKWFNSKELKLIHKEMFGNVWEWAGVYRKSVTSIGIQPGYISRQLEEFCLEVAFWFEHPVDFTFLEMSARVHHRLVFIHPFENGNGRFSRLVADRFLFSCRRPFPSWPNQINREGGERKEYINSLKEADMGNYEPLILFMKKLGAQEI
ncbi:mobile mystery protein B [Chlamydiales bacterium]|nr:mobile mystery protein B [Chlamydiales bacterium]